MLINLRELVFAVLARIQWTRSGLLLLYLCLVLSCRDVSGGVPGTANILSQADKLQLLQEHNNFRASKNATNMILLQWSEELATISQQYSQDCTEEANVNRSSQSTSFEDIGEIILSIPTPLYEISRYDDLLANHIMKSAQSDLMCVGSACSEYHQVLWAETESVGCGSTTCGNTTFVVCNYAPGASETSPPYDSSGPVCSACPPHVPECTESGLCYNTSWRLEDYRTSSLDPVLVVPTSRGVSHESSILLITTTHPSPSRPSVTSMRTGGVELVSSHSSTDLFVSTSSTRISVVRSSSSSTVVPTYSLTTVVARDYSTLLASVAPSYSTSLSSVASGYITTSTSRVPNYSASVSSTASGNSILSTSDALGYSTSFSSEVYSQLISKSDSDIASSLVSTIHTLLSTEFPQTTSSVTLFTSLPTPSSNFESTVSSPWLFSSNIFLVKSTASSRLTSKPFAGTFSSYKSDAVPFTFTVTVTQTPDITRVHCNCSGTEDVCAAEFRRLPLAYVLVIGLVPSVAAIALFLILIFVICLNCRRNSNVRRKHVSQSQSTSGNNPRRQRRMKVQDMGLNTTPGTLASIHLKMTSSKATNSCSFEPDISAILPDPPSTFVHDDYPSCRLGNAFKFVTPASNMQDSNCSTFSYLSPGDGDSSDGYCSQNPMFGLESIRELEETRGDKGEANEGGVARMIAKLEQGRGNTASSNC